jgi:hypothetical protein
MQLILQQLIAAYGPMSAAMERWAEHLLMIIGGRHHD